jgi:hypothetical protein
MQILNALVAIKGDRNNTLLKTDLTPPEVLLLQQLHGEDAVLQIEPIQNVERDPLAEIDRLKSMYPLQRERIQNIWRDWPADRFPTRIDMLGLNPALLKPVEASKPYTVSAKSA